MLNVGPCKINVLVNEREGEREREKEKERERGGERERERAGMSDGPQRKLGTTDLQTCPYTPANKRSFSATNNCNNCSPNEHK